MCHCNEFKKYCVLNLKALGAEPSAGPGLGTVKRPSGLRLGNMDQGPSTTPEQGCCVGR